MAMQSTSNKPSSQIGKPTKSILQKLPCNRSSMLSVRNEDAEQILRDIQIVDTDFKKIPFWKKVTLFTKLIIPSLLLAVTHSGNNFLNTMGFHVADDSHDIIISTSFGLSVFFNNVTVYSMTQPIIEKVGISCAKSFGARDSNGVKEHFIRGLVFFSIYTCVVYAPIIIFAENILLLVGIQPQIAKKTAHYQALLFPIDITRLLGEILVTYMVSQGIESSFGLFTMASLIVGFISAYYLGIHKEMGIDGWMISRGIFDTLNFLCILGVYIFKLKTKRMTLKNLERGFTGLGQFFCDVMKYTAVLYSEVLGWEFSTIVVTMTDSDAQIAAFTSVINMAYLVWNAGNGFSNTARTRINYLLGQGKGRAARNFFALTLIGMCIFASFISIGVFFGRSLIADIYASKNLEIRDELYKLLLVFSFFLIADFLFGFMFTISRSTNQICLNMCLDYLILIFGQLGINYYMVNYKNGNCQTVLVVLDLSLLLIYVLLGIRFFSMDWNTIDFEQEEEDTAQPIQNENLLIPLSTGEKHHETLRITN